MTDDLTVWFAAHPETENVILAAPDVNGVLRGKSLGVDQLGKIASGQVRMALSTPTVDIWGDGIAGCAQVRETGDCDVVLRPTGRMPVPSVLAADTAILPVDFWLEDGTAVETSCRHALIGVVERLRAQGVFPVVALELEFYLYDPQSETLDHPVSPITGARLNGRENAQISDLEHFAGFLRDVRENCAKAGIEISTINSENGTGMFEANLAHSEDVLRAVDEAVFARRIIRDTAQAHQLGATFMAKPFADLDGAGLHIHLSLLDRTGQNVFDDGGPEGAQALAQAAAGLLARSDEMQLIMAPHLSSYRRVQPNAYAPTRLCWGYDNRTVPVRIPGGAPSARRIEHRMAGADANPYLVTLAVLEAAVSGMTEGLEPSEPAVGKCYDQAYPRVVANMRDALRLFAQSDWVRSILPGLFHEAFVNCKAQELAVFESRVSRFEVDTYRDRV